MTQIMGYVLGDELGRGRRHRVVRARRAGERDEVALKCPLVPGPERSPLAVESRVLARVVHPHVVPLLEVIRLDDDQRPLALALELAKGGTLCDVSAHNHRLPASCAGPIALALTDALAHVHACGFAHGDIKPANVLLRDDGVPLLADFDNATPLGAAPSRAATPHWFSAAYAAPEVLAGQRPDDCSDVWALAHLLLGLVDPLSSGADDLEAALCDAIVIEASRRPSGATLRDRLGEAFHGVPFTPLDVTDAAALVGDDAPTCDWGPRPVRVGQPTPPTAPSRRVVAMATAGAVAIVGCSGSVYLAASLWTSAGDSADAAPSCSGDESVDDTCVRSIEWSTADAIATVTSADGTRRFAIGQPGDVLAVGDWNGDGRSSPGVYRPTDGTVHLFDSWARGDDEVVSGTSRDTRILHGRPRVVRVGERDEVVIDPAADQVNG